MIRVGAVIPRISSSGHAKCVVSSRVTFSTRLGKASGFGAVRRYACSIGGPGEELGGDRRERLERRGVHGVAGVGGRCDDELSHRVRVTDRQLQAGGAAHAVADNVGVVDLKVTDQGRRVVGHLLVRERPIDVGGMPMSLQLDRDHPPGLGQPGQDRAHHVDRHVRAVQ